MVTTFRGIGPAPTPDLPTASAKQAAIEAQLATLAEQLRTRTTPEAIRRFHALRLQTLDLPDWRDDPSYHWAEQTKKGLRP